LFENTDFAQNRLFVYKYTKYKECTMLAFSKIR